MMSAKVTIITPTYSKPNYFSECAESVLSQAYQDWVWWVVFNFDNGVFNEGYKSSLVPIYYDSRILPIYMAVDPDIRNGIHIPADIVNWLYPKVTTPYIFWLSDDDLIHPEGLEKLVKVLQMRRPVACTNKLSENLAYLDHTVSFDYEPIDAVYGRCLVQDEQPDGTFKDACWCTEGRDIAQGEDCDCVLDSGQILHTKALWDRATADWWRLDTSKSEAAHADGLLLTRLAQFAPIHYVNQQICTHRRTRLSEHHKPQIA